MTSEGSAIGENVSLGIVNDRTDHDFRDAIGVQVGNDNRSAGVRATGQSQLVARPFECQVILEGEKLFAILGSADHFRHAIAIDVANGKFGDCPNQLIGWAGVQGSPVVSAYRIDLTAVELSIWYGGKHNVGDIANTDVPIAVVVGKICD